MCRISNQRSDGSNNNPLFIFMKCFISDSYIEMCLISKMEWPEKNLIFLSITDFCVKNAVTICNILCIRYGYFFLQYAKNIYLKSLSILGPTISTSSIKNRQDLISHLDVITWTSNNLWYDKWLWSINWKFANILFVIILILPILQSGHKFIHAIVAYVNWWPDPITVFHFITTLIFSRFGIWADVMFVKCVTYLITMMGFQFHLSYSVLERPLSALTPKLLWLFLEEPRIQFFKSGSVFVWPIGAECHIYTSVN